VAFADAGPVRPELVDFRLFGSEKIAFLRIQFREPPPQHVLQ